MSILKTSLYDLNYAEFPFCYLTKNKIQGIKRIQISYHDEINYLGENIKREFYIQSLHMKPFNEIEKLKNEKNVTIDQVHVGFGGPLTLDIVYELHQLWFEQGFESNRIDIKSYHDFTKRLGWTKTGRNYFVLQRQLEALNSIKVTAYSSLVNGKGNPLASRSFYLFPWLENEHDEKDNKSFQKRTIIGIDERYFHSIKQNSYYFMPFDKQFFYSLTPLEKRLALYLGKIFNPVAKHEYTDWNRNLIEFSKQMPLLSDNPKILRKTFKRAFEGLIRKKYPFLERYEIQGDNVRMICEQPVEFETNVNVKKFVDQNNTLERLRKKPDYEVRNIIEDILQVTGDKHSINYYTNVAKTVDNDLLYQALSEARQDSVNPSRLFTHLMQRCMGK